MDYIVYRFRKPAELFSENFAGLGVGFCIISARNLITAARLAAPWVQKRDRRTDTAQNVRFAKDHTIKAKQTEAQM